MNYETRTVLLWINNTEDLNTAAREFVREHGNDRWDRGSTHEMRDWVKKRASGWAVRYPRTLQAELTNGALDVIDWDEIVAHLERGTSLRETR